MAVIPTHHPVMGLVNRYSPLKGSGLARFNDVDLGLTNGTVIPAAPGIVESNPLMVAGLNQFLLLAVVVSTGAANWQLVIEHCDPTTGVVVASEAPIAGLPFVFATLVPTEFGANAFLLANPTSSRVYYVIRLGFQATGGAGGGVFSNARPTQLYCATR